MNAKDKVAAMYQSGATNEQVAEWLFGPQWAMASTPKDGWEFKNNCWARVESKAKDWKLDPLQLTFAPAQPITVKLPATPAPTTVTIAPRALSYHGRVFSLIHYPDRDIYKWTHIPSGGSYEYTILELRSYTIDLVYNATGKTEIHLNGAPHARASDPDGRDDLVKIYNILVKL